MAVVGTEGLTLIFVKCGKELEVYGSAVFLKIGSCLARKVKARFAGPLRSCLKRRLRQLNSF